MDAHYNQLHKKYETFEKRQRRREKERLQHERYKMKERVDLIRGMDGKRYVYALFLRAEEGFDTRADSCALFFQFRCSRRLGRPTSGGWKSEEGGSSGGD